MIMMRESVNSNRVLEFVVFFYLCMHLQRRCYDFIGELDRMKLYCTNDF